MVSVSVTFHLMRVHIILVLVSLLTDHPFWERSAHSVDCMFSVLCIFVIQVISRFGLDGRDGFGFWFLQFLVMAYFLLLCKSLVISIQN